MNQSYDGGRGGGGVVGGISKQRGGGGVEKGFGEGGQIGTTKM